MEALNYSLDKVPYGKYALVFVDDRDVTGSVLHELYNSFHQRKKPQIFTGTEETANLKKWLREPKERENDFCIVGTQHQCNGIETDIVIHIYPEDCPLCGISSADPVIISRAMALLIVSTYQRVQCDCGWKLCEDNFSDGWITPDAYSDEEDNTTFIKAKVIVEKT